MGVNQSKLTYQPSLRSQRLRRSSTSKQRPAAAEETGPTLSCCTTRHGTIDPTTHSRYNGTNAKQTKTTTATTRHQQQNGAAALDSGYSSGWQQSSALFSHISSNITTATELSHFVLDDKPANTASIVSQVTAAVAAASNPSSASSSLAAPFFDNAPITTKRILQQLASAPHGKTHAILDSAFARAYDQQSVHSGENPVDAAYHAALQWSQHVAGDEDARRAAQVWVARYHVECDNGVPANGFSQLRELADGGCWQAFLPLAMCYLRGVVARDATVIQPVDKTMACQWFSTAAQLDPKTTADTTVALAQLHLGKLMAQEHDNRKAVHWFMKSADNGNAHAQFIVGVHYAMGLEVDTDRLKAKHYMRLSAEKGFVHAETALGILHLEDHEYDRGLLWLAQAEQKGDPRALFRLALLYKSAQHRRHQPAAMAMATIQQDRAKAAQYLQAAAAHGHPAAQFQLALAYQKGSLGLKPNLARADQLLRQSAKAGYTPAQRFLGYMYREGWVLPSDSAIAARAHHKKSDKIAFDWFYRAAQRQDVYAHILVGQCYEHGRGVPVNTKTALEYYQRAASKDGDPCQAQAQQAIADLLLRTGSIAEAFQWFVMAAKHEDGETNRESGDADNDDDDGTNAWWSMRPYDKRPSRRAKLMVARYHLHGWGGVTVDRQRAYSMLTELATQSDNDGHAHYWLASCYLEGLPGVCEIKQAAAFKHYRIATRTSVLDSEYQVARMYATGTGVDRDRSEALAWYKKAANKGHIGALCILGYHHYSMATAAGSQDEAKNDNIRKAMHYFEKAADLGNADAMERLGDILMFLAATPTLTLQGRRDRDQQRARALHYYTKAAAKEHTAAQRELGKLYYAGVGVPQDYGRAFALFSRAAAKNDPAATLLLGNCYEHGHGVTKDEERALDLYLRAAEWDYPLAPFTAAELYNDLNRIQEAYAQYKLTANDERLKDSTEAKTAECMISRYVLDYDDMFRETKQEAYSMLSRLATDNEAFTPAFYWLAYCFHHGIGTPVDLVQAIDWYQKAAEEDDHVDALVQLGIIHSQGGTGVPVDEGHALILFQRAVERGHPAGQYELGMAHWRGLHSMIIDEMQATALFQDAATQGHGRSYWALGQMAYEKHDDKATALHCWQNGTREGDSWSMRCQARLLLECMPIHDDPLMQQQRQQQYTDAIELLVGAAQAGDVESYFYLGRIFLAESAMIKSTMMQPPSHEYADEKEHAIMAMQQQYQKKAELAKHYLQTAALAGHVEAMFLAAQILYEQHEYAAAHEYYERAAEHGYALARVMRARYLLGNGLPGIKPDPQFAYKDLMDCAMDQGCVEAYHSLGQCHEYGLGTKQDYEQALTWYLKSVDATDDAQALYCIGRIYAQGLVPPPSADQHKDMEAYHWFELASRKSNHSRAHYELGVYHLHGITDNDTILLQPDPDAALHHLQLAAQQDDHDAMLILGTMLHDEKWLECAAELGSRDALRELGRLYYLGAGAIAEQDFERAYTLFHKAASMGDRDAAFFVGNYYEHGIHHIVPDLQQALVWYEVANGGDASNSGEHWWMAELAMARVLHQLPGMHMRAYGCYQAAYEHAPSNAEQMLPDIMLACYRLHGWHNNDEAMEEEQREALATLLKYAHAGEARVFYQVGRCYETGLVAEKNLDEAFAWYSRLEQLDAQLDDDDQDMLEQELQEDISKALLRLAAFYRHGWTTRRDPAKAATLEKRASSSMLESNHHTLPSPLSSSLSSSSLS